MWSLNIIAAPGSSSGAQHVDGGSFTEVLNEVGASPEGL